MEYNNFNTRINDYPVDDSNAVGRMSYADAYESMQNDDDVRTSSNRNSKDREKYDRRRSRRSRSSSRRRSRSRSDSRSRSRDRDDRNRSPYYRDYYKSRRRSRSSRSRSRSRSRSYDRERDDDYYKYRRSPRTDDEYSSDGVSRYRSDRQADVQPNSTIVVKGLPPTCDEALIWDLIGRQGFAPKDVRVLKKKDTGQSRGFGFVEFIDVDEATRWMEYAQGHLQIDDRHYADLQYSINKNLPANLATNAANALQLQRGGDWICSKCGTNNFKKRDQCFKCNIKRDESEALGGEGFNEIGVMPSDTLLLRSVPITADEERILSCLKKLSSLDVRRIVVARHGETKQSRGYAYVEMGSITEAAQLLTTLTAVTKLNIDGREIFVSYSKLPLTSVLSGTNIGQTDEWSNQLALLTGTGSVSKNQRSANTYGAGIMQTDLTNSAAAVAQSAIKKAQVMRQVAAQQVQAQMHAAVSAATILVPGAALILQQHQQILAAQALQEMAAVQLLQEQASLQGAAAAAACNLGTVQTPYGELPRYPQPDVNVYQYEPSSGYYFDPTTGLYYDAKTQYYYNSETQQYLYWDSSYKTYLPAPTSSSSVPAASAAADATKGDLATTLLQKNAPANDTTVKDSIEKKEVVPDKTEKVKTAKQIQKDMEKWAKQLNQKKDVKPNTTGSAKANVQSVLEPRHSATADVAFSALEKNVGAFGTGLVSYDGGESDDETSSSMPVAGRRSFSPIDDNNGNDDKTITDWEKLACLLCRRQFPSKEVLIKHQQFSDLHKQNMEARSSMKTTIADHFTEPVGSQYRDRAKERREKFGLDDKPQPNRLKEKYLESLSGYDEPTVSGLKSDNIGNKLLKGMGWQEGQGLGRKNQGIVDPIMQQRRTQGAGLGSTNSIVSASPSSSYKEHVRAALRQKFYEQS